MKLKIFRFKKVKSTNNTALRIIKKLDVNYGMIISEIQTNGRGQYGKKWISYRGNVFTSFFFNVEKFAITIKQFTKLNCLLVKNLLSTYYKGKITYKQPNDLLIDKKKICGILHETFIKFNRKYLIVGIGINLIKNPQINDYQTNKLSNLTNKKLSKSKIEKEIKKIFEIRLSKFCK